MSMKEIAEMAGVSKQAVSAALRGKPNISVRTRERIQRIARQIGYEPHGPASALATGRAGTIGVVPSVVAGPHQIDRWLAMMLGGLWRALEAKGLGVVLLSNEEAASGVPKMIARRSVDGAAFFVVPPEQTFAWMREHQIPVVAVDVGPREGVDAVYPDHARGVEIAVKHLVSLGHRRIAYVNNTGCPAMRAHFVTRTRCHSYLKTLAELGLQAPPGSERNAPVAERVDALFGQASPPTGIIAFDDDVALEVIQYLHERQLRVPVDVSVVGIDDMRYAALSSPQLTTVRVPFDEMGVRAGEFLVERLAEPELPPRQVMMDETLIVRESTAPPPSS